MTDPQDDERDDNSALRTTPGPKSAGHSTADTTANVGSEAPPGSQATILPDARRQPVAQPQRAGWWTSLHQIVQDVSRPFVLVLLLFVVILSTAAWGLHACADAAVPPYPSSEDDANFVNVYAGNNSAAVTVEILVDRSELATLSVVAPVGTTLLITTNADIQVDSEAGWIGVDTPGQAAARAFALDYACDTAAAMRRYFCGTGQYRSEVGTFQMPAGSIDEHETYLSAVLPGVGVGEQNEAFVGRFDQQAEPFWSKSAPVSGSAPRYIAQPELLAGYSRGDPTPSHYSAGDDGVNSELFWIPRELSVDEIIQPTGSAPLATGDLVISAPLPAVPTNEGTFEWTGTFGTKPILLAVTRSAEDRARKQDFWAAILAGSAIAALVAFLQEAVQSRRTAKDSRLRSTPVTK